jgi:NAD(P)-dependent dehydrogenase (short-subunit alcohol dehydrogenase family)
MPYTDFEGKVAIVTGAEVGIGRACAGALVASGMRVAGTTLGHFRGLHVPINNAVLGMNAENPRYEGFPFQI